MELCVNTVIRYVGDQRLERILWIDAEQKACFVIDIQGKEFPQSRWLEEIQYGIEQGLIVIEESDPWTCIVNPNMLSEKEKEKWETDWQIVQAIASKDFEPQIFVSTERSKLVRQAAERFGLSEKQIGRILKRYWSRGKTKLAVLPDFANRGGRGKERRQAARKRGRPKKFDSIYAEINVSEDVKKIFRIALDKYYFKANRPSLRWAYEQMLKEYFSEDRKLDNGVELPVIESGTAIPSFPQFRYWFRKWRDLKKEISLRESAKKFHQRYRPVLGSTQQDVFGPGSVYQIDATVADVYLVSSFDRTKIIGRPVLYLVMDGYSRMIAGLYVGLEGPSWQGAMMALKHACESKVEWCRQFGIEIREEDWPCVYLPESILADRGELLSDKALSIIEHLQIAVKNTSPYRPDWKAVVEKHFDLIQTHVKPFLPGAIQEDFQERGAKDYRLNATLTIPEFTQILIKCVLYYNNRHCLTGYQRDAEQIAQDVQPIPIHLWNFGIQHRSGRLRKVSEDVLRFNLLPTAEATVTPGGIRFQGMYYSCPTALKEKWFVHARTHGTWKVAVAYDPRNVSQIFLRLGRTSYDVCNLLESQARYRNLSLEDVNYLLAWEKQNQATSQDLELRERITLAAEIEAIVEEARKKTRAESIPISKSQKLRDIRENRRQEKERNRKQESFSLVRSSANERLERRDEEEQEERSYLGLLKQKQEDAFYGDR
jgi:hypothetical protein